MLPNWLSDETVQHIFIFHRTANDRHRQIWDGVFGEVNIGGAATELPDETILKICQAVKLTKVFDDDLHSRGHVEVEGRHYYWTINRYTSKAKINRCGGRLLGYRDLMIGYPEDFIMEFPPTDK